MYLVVLSVKTWQKRSQVLKLPEFNDLSLLRPEMLKGFAVEDLGKPKTWWRTIWFRGSLVTIGLTKRQKMQQPRLKWLKCTGTNWRKLLIAEIYRRQHQSSISHMVFLSGLFSGDCGIDRIAEDVQFRMERKRRKERRWKLCHALAVLFPSKNIESICYLYVLPAFHDAS